MPLGGFVQAGDGSLTISIFCCVPLVGESRGLPVAIGKRWCFFW